MVDFIVILEKKSLLSYNMNIELSPFANLHLDKIYCCRHFVLFICTTLKMLLHFIQILTCQLNEITYLHNTFTYLKFMQTGFCLT